MTTVATDGQSMAADGQVSDHCETIVDHKREKVRRLSDGRIVGAAGSAFDAVSWAAWLESGKEGDCPIDSDLFVGLILNKDGTVLWVDHKGREVAATPPCAIGSGQDLALGAMDAGATPGEAVNIACKRDPGSGGRIKIEYLTPRLEEAA